MNTKPPKESEEHGARQQTLFEMPERPRPADGPDPPGTPRVKAANRSQVCFRQFAWNDILPEDHETRTVWAYVETIDLTPLHELIDAVERRPG